MLRVTLESQFDEEESTQLLALIQPVHSSTSEILMHVWTPQMPNMSKPFTRTEESPESAFPSPTQISFQTAVSLNLDAWETSAITTARHSSSSSRLIQTNFMQDVVKVFRTSAVHVQEKSPRWAENHQTRLETCEAFSFLRQIVDRLSLKVSHQHPIYLKAKSRRQRNPPSIHMDQDLSLFFCFVYVKEE